MCWLVDYGSCSIFPPKTLHELGVRKPHSIFSDPTDTVSSVIVNVWNAHHDAATRKSHAWKIARPIFPFPMELYGMPYCSKEIYLRLIECCGCNSFPLIE